MFSWFMCLLCDSCVSGNGSGPSDRSLPGPLWETGVWWSPIESSGDVDGFRVLEGDVLVPLSVGKTLKNAIKSKDYLWEDGVIPFEFGKDFMCPEESLILEAMAVLEEKTCVRFVKRTKEETFVRFQKEKNGCFAPIGKFGGKKGPLPVNLQSPECFRDKSIIEHELLHVVGLFHEHSRPDRDDFVTVHWCNIRPDKETEFLKGSSFEMTTFDLPYDYSSIMHYPRWAFSRNGKPTITAKGDPNMTLGQKEGPTVTDLRKIAKMYNCEATEVSAHP